MLPSPEPRDVRIEAMDYIVLEVADVLAARDIAIEYEAGENFGARGFTGSVYIRDPDGNSVEIRTYAAPSDGGITA